MSVRRTMPVGGPSRRAAYAALVTRPEEEDQAHDPFAAAPVPAACSSSEHQPTQPMEVDDDTRTRGTDEAGPSTGVGLSSSPLLRRSLSGSPQPMTSGAFGSQPFQSPPPPAAAAAAGGTPMTPPPPGRTRLTHSARDAPRSGQQHLNALLQRMGKQLPRSATSAASQSSSVASAFSTLSATSSAVASAAFDAAVRANTAAARAEFLRDLGHGGGSEETEEGEEKGAGKHLFLGYDSRLSPPTWKLSGSPELLTTTTSRILGAGSAAAAASSPLGSSPSLTRTRSSPRLQNKTQSREGSQSSNSRGHSPTPTAAPRTDAPAAAAAAAAPSSSVRASSVVVVASTFAPRDLSSRFSASTTGGGGRRPTVIAASASVRMEDISQPLRTATQTDVDADEPFTFASDGVLARERAAHLEAERKRAASKAIAAKMAAKRKHEGGGPGQNSQPNKKQSPAKSSAPGPSTASTPAGAATPLRAPPDLVDDPFEVAFSPSPKMMSPQPKASPPPTSATAASAASAAAASSPADIARRAVSGLKKYTPSKQISRMQLEDDPFERPVSASPAAAAAATATTSPNPTRSPPPTAFGGGSAGLPRSMPPTTQRAASLPTVGGGPHRLPPNVAAFLGAQTLTPRKAPAPASPKDGAQPTTPNTATSSPTAGITTGVSSPSAVRSPSLARAASSELRDQRLSNLAAKSHTQLLLDALLGKQSPELKAIEAQALTPLQRVRLMKLPTPTPQPSGTLASKLGRKLKAKVGQPSEVGYNSKQRARARRADGFIGDMTPLLEVLIEYLLANGADPNGRDADQNHALWLALQMKGSERIVRMLLEKGAECVHAVESEDESTDEEDRGHRRDCAGDGDEHKENHRIPSRVAEAVKKQLRLQQNVLDCAALAVGKPSSLSTSLEDALAYEKGSTVDLAMKMGNERHVRLLLRAGHTPALIGRTRLMHYAGVHRFQEEAADALVDALWTAVKETDAQQVAAITYHLDRKNIDAQDSTGRTPLYYAVEQKDPDLGIVRSLLKAGANPNKTDISETPMAVFPLCRQAKKSTSVLLELCRYRLDVSAKVTDSGQTLVEFAADACARPESIQLLERAKRMHDERATAKAQIGTDQDVFMFRDEDTKPAVAPAPATMTMVQSK